MFTKTGKFDRKIWLFHKENETYIIPGRKSTESQQGNYTILMHRLFVAGKILRKGFIFFMFLWHSYDNFQSKCDKARA